MVVRMLARNDRTLLVYDCPNVALVQCLALLNMSVLTEIGLPISLLAVVCYTLTCIYNFVLPVTR